MWTVLPASGIFMPPGPPGFVSFGIILLSAFFSLRYSLLCRSSGLLEAQLGSPSSTRGGGTFWQGDGLGHLLLNIRKNISTAIDVCFLPVGFAQRDTVVYLAEFHRR